MFSQFLDAGFGLNPLTAVFRIKPLQVETLSFWVFRQPRRFASFRFCLIELEF